MSAPHSETPVQHPGSSPVTAVILAGGLGRRMGNVDKGLTLLEGRPLIAWVLQRIAAQVEEVLINANRNNEKYATFGYRVIADRIPGFAGPLAGMHSGLSECRHELMIAVPCDTPCLPDDLVGRLAAPLNDEDVDLAVAQTGTQSHPVICLTRKRVLPHLTAYLEGGGRKVDAWYASLHVAQVAFDDRPEDFRNINTSDELRALERFSRS